MPGLSGSLDGGELQMNSPHFDPTRQPLRLQILSKIGVSPNSMVEAMEGNCGGLNQGVWVVKDHSQKFIMKLVKGVNSFGMPTEGEKFTKIHSKHPGILEDSRLAFPMKIFRLMSPGQGKLHELIVMRKARGVLLSEYIATMRSENRMQQLLQIFEQCGQFLAEFHACYGNQQHNDFTPSNIFYDPASSTFTLIDLGDMGPKFHEADVERFINALNILSSCYGHQFFVDGKRCFESGYHRARRG
jgi:serine/threonine protein kinase